MFFNLIVYSKNKNSILNFNKIVSKICFNKNIKTIIFCKQINRKKKIKKLTLLKSPHVNKKAQEKFKIYTYIKKYKIYTNKMFKFLTVLKKIKLNILFDVGLKIKFIIFKNKFKNKFINFYNPNKLYFKKLLNNTSNYKKYFKYFNNFGKFKLLSV